ncbi:MAG: TRAP transporter small permease subunit [Desulfobacterales bacterium]|nr:TRAP transporter small permease subunit [Desulfobacterales bacterium]
MKNIITMMKIINSVNEKIARYASFLVFLLILTLTYEVVARYGFNAPTQWSFDLTYFLCSMTMIFGMATTWQSGGHVSVDLISANLPRRKQAFLNVFFLLTLFFLCWINIIWMLTPHLLNSWKIQERSMTGFMPPIYPYKTWIYIGIAMLILQGIEVFIKELYMLIKGKELELS